MLSFTVAAQATDSDSPRAKIIEKGTTRYFILGDQEYVCNTDNKISDTSAKQILKTVRKIYSSTEPDEKTKKKYDTIVNALWGTLHQVCVPGEVYDQIIFECLKYKLNDLFQFIVAPKIYKNDDNEKILIPGIAHVSMSYKEGISKSLPHHLRPTTHSFYKIGSVSVSGLGNTVKVMSIKGSKNLFEGYGEYAVKSASRQIAGSRDDVKMRFDAEVSRIKTKTAGDNFVNRFESILNYFADKSDSDSFVYSSEWDNILASSTGYILKFRKNYLDRKLKVDFDTDAMNLFASKIMHSCLKFCKTNKTKDALIVLGIKHNLKFTVPKQTKESHTLF